MPSIGGIELTEEELAPARQSQGERPSIGSLLKAGGIQAYSGLRYGLPYAVEKAANTATTQDDQYYQAWLRNSAQRAQEAAPQGPAGVSDLFAGRAGLSDVVFENLAYSAPQLLATAAGAVAGGLPGAIGVNTPFFIGSNTQRAVEDGQLTRDEAARSLLVAPAQAASDALVGKFIPGIGGKLGFSAVGGSGLVSRTGKSIFGAALTEAVTETGQQVAERYAAGLPLTNQEAMHEFVEAFGTAAIVGGGLGSFGGLRGTGADTNEASQVTNDNLSETVDRTLGLPAPAAPAGLLPSPRRAELDLEVTRAPVVDPTALPAPEGGSTIFAPPDAPGVIGNQQDAEIQAVLRSQPTGDLQAALEQVPPENTREAQLLQAELQRRRTEADQRQVDIYQLDFPRLQERLDAVNDTTHPSEVQLLESAFQAKLAETKKGLRGRFVKELEAVSHGELLEKVYDQVFTEQDTRKGTTELAQRLGLLDKELNPTRLAGQVEARKAQANEAVVATPQPPRDASFEAEVSELGKKYRFRSNRQSVSDRRQAMDYVLDARTPEELDQRLYERLADDDVATSDRGVVSRLERLAQERGLVDENLDFTEKGVFVAHRAGIPAEERMQAAIDQGFTGSDASYFERGILSVDGLPEGGLTQSELKAFIAGQNYAETAVPDVATAAQTSNTLARVGRGSVTTGEQQTLVSLNRQIDALTHGSDADRAELRRMIRAGEPTENIRAAIADVAVGKTLFQQPERQAVDFKGEVVTPGVRARNKIRQRKAQEARDEQFLRERGRNAKGRAATREVLSMQVQDAFEAGTIDARARIKAIHMLTLGDFVEVMDILKGNQNLTNEMRTTRREFLAGVAVTAATSAGVVPRTAQATTKATNRLVGHLQNGNVVAALEHIRDNSTNGGYRILAKLMLKGGGWGNVALELFPDRGSLHGSTQVMDDGSSYVRLFGEKGLTEETVLHELLHAYVQQRWAGLGVYFPSNKKILGDTIDRQDALVRSWQVLWSDIRTALEATNPELVNTEAWAGWTHQDPDEMFSWVLTNGDAQAYLRSVDRTGKPVTDPAASLWEQVKKFFVELLGRQYMPPKARTALDEIMDAGHGLLVAGRDVKPGDFSAKLVAELNARDNKLSTAPPRLVSELNASTREAAQQVKKLIDQTPVQSLYNRVGAWALRFFTVGHLADHYGDQLAPLKAFERAQSHRRATDSRFAKLFESVYQGYDKAQVADERVARLIPQLMEFTINEIDPRKGWADHTHLHERANKAQLMQEVRRANNLYRDLRSLGQAQHYENFVALNETLQLSSAVVALRNLVLADKELAREIGDRFAADPMESFRENAQQHTSAVGARDYWSNTLTQQADYVTEFIKKLRGDVVGGSATKEQTALSKRLRPVENLARQIKSIRTNMERAPYFHLGRAGKHFVAFRAGGKDGIADAAKIETIAQRLADAGVHNARISTNNQSPDVYIVLENEQQREVVFALARQMQNDGLLDPDKDPRRGVRGTNDDAGTFRDTPEHLKQFLDLIEKSELYDTTGLSPDDKKSVEAQKNHAIAQARELWLDLLPDSSLAKVLAPRKGVQGFNTDMVRNFAQRYELGTTAISGLAASRELGGAVADMRQAVKDAQLDPDADVDLLSSLTSEILKRESQRAEIEEGLGFADKMRAYSHAYFLGGSISYGAINLTQLGVLLWPELAKKRGGFVRGAKAIANATPEAFNVMRAVFDEAKKHGWKHLGDVSITSEVLQKAGLSKEKSDFVMKMVASGVIDIGAAARELGRVSEGQVGTREDTVLRLAGGVGLYTETFTRLVAALSAREMDGGTNNQQTVEYARNVINQSMLNYSTWNTARALGKKGMLGQATPIVTQFMQYSVQVLEKLYREIYRALPNTGGAAVDKAEARRFLGAHAAAITAVSGTLGLPFATVAARAVELLVDLFDDDDEPYDVTAAYRRMLAGVFGKDVGEVIARGVPRAIGVDISRRAGEQDILPFSRVLADRRGIVEAGGDWLTDNATGAAGGMIGSMYEGVGKMADGDFLGAVAAAAPLALRGGAKAAVMSRDGYVDARGNVLPIDPTAGAYLAQLLGFNPAEKAEYSEKNQDQYERRGALTRQANQLRDQITTAVIRGDQDKMRSVIARARKFDSDNPAFAVLPDIEGAVQRRRRDRAFARATGLPYGVNRKDVEARELTSYGN